MFDMQNTTLKKRVSLFSTISFFVCYLSSQSLEQYIQLGLENHPEIAGRQLEYQAALQKSIQAKSLPEPEINASTFLNPMMLPMGNQLGSISAMQMFPWKGTLPAMEKEALQMAAVQQARIEVTKNELVFRIKKAWYPMLQLEAQAAVLREQLRILETDQILATAKFRQGQAPMTDAIRADLMIAETQTELTLLEQKRQPLQAVFNRLLNRDAQLTVTVAEHLPEARISAGSESLDVTNHPALEVMDREISAAQAAEAAAGLMRKPMMGAGIQYMPLAKRDNEMLPPNTGRDMIMPMLRVTLPIWKTKYDAAVEEQRLLQSAFAKSKESMVNELAAEYAMTRYELEETVQMEQLLQTQIGKTQQIIDLMLAAYSQSGQEFMEILRLQEQIFRYRLQQIDNRTRHQLVLVRLDNLTGKFE